MEETFPAIENSELPYFSWDESCQAKGGKAKLEASKDKWNAGFLCLPAASLPADDTLNVKCFSSTFEDADDFSQHLDLNGGVRRGDGAV